MGLIVLLAQQTHTLTNLLKLVNTVQEVGTIIKKLVNASAPRISHSGIGFSVSDATYLNTLIFLTLLVKAVPLLNFMTH